MNFNYTTYLFTYSFEFTITGKHFSVRIFFRQKLIFLKIHKFTMCRKVLINHYESDKNNFDKKLKIFWRKNILTENHSHEKMFSHDYLFVMTICNIFLTTEKMVGLILKNNTYVFTDRIHKIFSYQSEFFICLKREHFDLLRTFWLIIFVLLGEALAILFYRTKNYRLSFLQRLFNREHLLKLISWLEGKVFLKNT